MAIETLAWVLPRPRMKSLYKGGFPLWFEQKLLKLLGFYGDTGRVLHIFGGKAEYGWRLDMKAEVEPHVIGDAHHLPFRSNCFDVVIADPPYSNELSKSMYGTGKIMYKQWAAEAARVCKPGGFVVVYHIVVQTRPKDTVLHKRILLEVGHNHRIRWVGIFRKSGNELVEVEMDHDFEKVFHGLGFQTKGYPGAFTPVVEADISQVVAEIQATLTRPIRILHLFSGISLIGDIRVDINCDEATHKQGVLDFVNLDKGEWDLCIGDPPYSIAKTGKTAPAQYIHEEVGGYGRVSSAAADVGLRNALVAYFIRRVDNVLWLDMCAPFPKRMSIRNWRRQRLYFYFPGGWHTMRVMSWLSRTM